MNDNLAVYLVEAKNGLIKVGVSKSITNRFNGLLAGSPIPLKLLATTNKIKNAREVEKNIQKIYISKHSHSEWFNLTKSDVENIINTFNFNRQNNNFELSKSTIKFSNKKIAAQNKKKYILDRELKNCHEDLQGWYLELTHSEILTRLNKLVSLQKERQKLYLSYNKKYPLPTDLIKIIQKIENKWRKDKIDISSLAGILIKTIETET